MRVSNKGVYRYRTELNTIREVDLEERKKREEYF